MFSHFRVWASFVLGVMSNESATDLRGRERLLIGVTFPGLYRSTSHNPCP